FNSQVKPESRELAIIATAREKDCPYVWAAHAPAARNAGVSDAAVTAVRDRGDLTSLPAGEGDTVDYVRQLSRSNAVTQALFDRRRCLSRCRRAWRRHSGSRWECSPDRSPRGPSSGRRISSS